MPATLHRVLLVGSLGLAVGGCIEPSSRLRGSGSDAGTDTDDDTTQAMTSTISASASDSGGSDSGDETDGDTDTHGGCEEGCPCVDDSECDAGFHCEQECVLDQCGDQRADGAEECDDGNKLDGDGCDNDCSRTRIVIDVSFRSTCALIEGGRVRCWGANNQGKLGYGFTDTIGDDEHPYEAGDVKLPGPISQLQSGDTHVCGMLEGTNDVICWGASWSGQLGYGNTDTIGDNELPSSVGNVDVGAAIVDLSGGIGQTCVIQANGAIRCWGPATYGQLGYGNTDSIGDTEDPSDATALEFVDKAVQVTAGWFHTCAMFDSGAIRCWGRSSEGQLGQGDVENMGDTEPATVLGSIDFGTDATPVSIAAGDFHTCALFNDGTMRCWGANDDGQLGLGSVDHLGDTELPSAAGPIDFDIPVIQMDAGGSHTCAVLEDYRVYCWGRNNDGQLGLGHAYPDAIGDNERPKDVPPVQVLGPRDQPGG